MQIQQPAKQIANCTNLEFYLGPSDNQAGMYSTETEYDTHKNPLHAKLHTSFHSLLSFSTYMSTKNIIPIHME